MSLSKFHLLQAVFVSINTLLVEFWLNIWPFFWQNWLFWLSGTDLTFKIGPQIFDRTDGSTLWRSFQKLSVTLLYPFHSQLWFGLVVIALLEHPVVSKFLSWWFEVMLKNSEEIHIFHYSIHFMQCTRPTSRKTATEHDDAFTMLNSLCSVLRV